MEIYADPITINCRKVLAGCALIGAPYTLKHVDYFAGAQKEMPYIGINPNASIPALVDGDLVLWESNAILQYVADKMASNAAYPNDLKIRADVNRWLFWESASWFPACYFYLVENCIKPLLGGATDEAAVAAHNAQFHKLASILDARLANNTWVAGTAAPTIADIVLASPMHLHGWQKMPLEPHANVRRWLTESVEALPCWKSTWVGEGFTLKQAA